MNNACSAPSPSRIIIEIHCKVVFKWVPSNGLTGEIRDEKFMGDCRTRERGHFVETRSFSVHRFENAKMQKISMWTNVKRFGFRGTAVIGLRTFFNNDRQPSPWWIAVFTALDSWCSVDVRRLQGLQNFFFRGILKKTHILCTSPSRRPFGKSRITSSRYASTGLRDFWRTQITLGVYKSLHTSATKIIRFNRFNAYSIQRQVHRESRKIRFYCNTQRIWKAGFKRVDA